MLYWLSYCIWDWGIWNELECVQEVKSFPVCFTLFLTVQQCPDPGEVVNGARSVRPEAGFAVGTVVRFSCNQGYQLEGPSQISCHGRDTGSPKWSDRSPKCVCKSLCCTFLLLSSVWLQCYCKFMKLTANSLPCIFSVASKIRPMPKPWCPWQWLSNLVQAQLPSRRNSAFLLLWGLWTYRWGQHQLCPWTSLSVEQPTTILQR